MAKTLEGYESYRHFMDRLAECNVDEYIDLPMIAVMGDTSSGKSSLLSNISLIELPSNDNLTTRCPIMLKMHHAISRSACVKVIWKDKPDCPGVEFTERRIEEENWNSITSAIADAQAHIILKSGKEVARDIVSVDVRAPHCENLTLVDLPGIVRTAGKDESATIADEIQGLMNDYLSNPRCVILAVQSSNVDFHNSQILADAKKVDPETRRTIPVLTKPDLIDDGGEAGVKELLLGLKTDSFDLGFHMCKGRGQAALNKNESIEQGLKDEESFFNNTEPWRGVEDKNLLGTKNLRVKLAGLHMELIRSSFKGIVFDLKVQQDQSVMDYQALGEIPSSLADKRALFRSIKEDIWKGIGTNVLHGHIDSLHSDSEMRPSAKFLDASQKFQDSLNSSKLAKVSDVTVGIKVVARIDRKDVRGEVCFIDENTGKVFLKDGVVSKGIAKSSVTSETTNKPGNIIQHGSSFYIERDGGTVDQLHPVETAMVRPDPEWISALIRQNRPYKLPVFINNDVFEAIVADLIKKEWAPPTMLLLDFTSKLMDSAADKFIKEMKKIKSFPFLETFLAAKASEIVDSLKKSVRSKVEDFIRREQVPFSQNHYLFEIVCKLRSQRLMDEVLTSIKGQYGTGSTNVDVNPATLTSMIENIFKRNQERSVDDHATEEMQNALNSYGKVALKRFIDNVPMLCIEIMQDFADKMNDLLSETTDEEIERVVVAPSNIVVTRKNLKRKADALEKGIAALRELF